MLPLHTLQVWQSGVPSDCIDRSLGLVGCVCVFPSELPWALLMAESTMPLEYFLSMSIFFNSWCLISLVSGFEQILVILNARLKGIALVVSGG